MTNHRCILADNWVLRVAILVVVILGMCRCSVAQVGELLRWVPDDSNALVILDAQSLFDSALARRDGWRESYADQYAAGPLVLPPDAQQFVMAAELDFAVMIPKWEIASMSTEGDRSADYIAGAVRGEVDQVGGLPVVKTPFDAYVVRWEAGRFGVFAPANRQALSRWIRQSGAENTTTLSPYLARLTGAGEGAARIDADATIRMAIDLLDVFPESEVRSVLAGSKVLRDASINSELAAMTLASINGITLLVDVSDRIDGELLVHFSGDVTTISKVAKPLLMEQLRNVGALLEDLESWDVNISDGEVRLTGQLSESGLRRLFSLFAMGRSRSMPVGPEAPQSPAKVSPPITRPEEPVERGPDPIYSQKYFQSVSGYVAELQRSAQVASPYQFMMWIDTYADRIDQLPTVGVDEELLAYGQRVSQQLRQTLGALNGLNQQSMVQQSQVIPNRTVTYGMQPTRRTVNYGGYRSRLYAPFAYQSVDVGGAMQQQQQIQREAMGKADGLARNILGQISKDTEAMRAKMSQRYQVEF